MSCKPIYLDYMATTPVDPIVAKKMCDYLTLEGEFGNPASTTHPYGLNAAKAIENARTQIATVVGASTDEIIFTSGATEADNLAIIGASQMYQRKGRHVITMQTEHKAVLDSFKQLEKEGFSVSYLPPLQNGLLDIELLQATLRPDTILVSIMHVNNEIGVIQDIERIGACLQDKGIIFHVDAAQSAGKLEINLSKLPIHLMSFSAHKNYGPKGIGALYVQQKPRIRIMPMSFGGGHERGMRSGTLPTHQIVGMGEAFELSEKSRIAEQARIELLKNQLWNGICTIPGICLNGHAKQRIPGNINIYFEDLPSEELRRHLHEFAFSSTSACSSSLNQASYVLKAIGLSSVKAQNAMRLSIGRFTTEKDIKQLTQSIHRAVNHMRDSNISRV